MQDTFTPLSLTISQIFINGDPLYNIPNYQRPYSWVDEQVEKLWDDIFTSYENNKQDNEIDTNYFLGSLIVVPNGGFEDVVDGQQRLTTLMILLCIVKELYPEINKETDPIKNPTVIKIGKLKNCIYNSNDLNRLRLYTHPTHQNDFETYILKNTKFSDLPKPTNKEIENSPKFKFINTAFIYWNKLTKLGEEEAGNFINYLFNQVKIIKISCSNRAFAIKLFQVLNDRGLDLAPADLIKSFLLSSLKDIQHNAFMADWQSIEQTTEYLDTSLTDLFTFYEYYLLGTNPKKSLVDELEIQFKKQNSNAVISDFKKFVNTYQKEIHDKNDKLIYSFWNLSWATYWKTILLTALHTNYSDYSKLSSLLRRYYYLNWIAGKTLTAIKQTSFNLIGFIKSKKSIAEIEHYLENKLEQEGIIPTALKNLSGNIYYEAWIKPLLIMVEYNQTDSDFLNFINMDKNLQVEHILPQSYSGKKDWAHINEEFATKYLHTAGNLTLLSGRKNIEAQNYSFEDKISIYQGQGRTKTKNEGITSFRISQKIVDDYNSNKYEKKWTEEAIIDRHNWFFEQVGEILDIKTDTLKIMKDKK